MASGRWWTKATLSTLIQASTHGVSARLSDLRTQGHTINKRYAGGGVYLYRMEKP